MEIEAALLTAVTTLGGVVVYLYKLQIKQGKESHARSEKHYTEIKSKLESCEVRHEEANKKIVQLSEKVGKLAGMEHVCEKLLTKLGGEIGGQIQKGSED